MMILVVLVFWIFNVGANSFLFYVIYQLLLTPVLSHISITLPEISYNYFFVLYGAYCLVSSILFPSKNTETFNKWEDIFTHIFSIMGTYFMRLICVGIMILSYNILF